MPTKRCFRCGEIFSLEDFYPHPRMRDGHLNKCKKCTKGDALDSYRKKISTPEGAAAERKRGREKHHRLYSVGRNWHSPEADKRTKLRAKDAISKAVRAGKIKKPSVCMSCSSSGRLEGHHHDYSKPLEVKWLCWRCHRRAHATHPERIKGGGQ